MQNTAKYNQNRTPAPRNIVNVDNENKTDQNKS